MSQSIWADIWGDRPLVYSNADGFVPAKQDDNLERVGKPCQLKNSRKIRVRQSLTLQPQFQTFEILSTDVFARVLVQYARPPSSQSTTPLGPP